MPGSYYYPCPNKLKLLIFCLASATNLMLYSLFCKGFSLITPIIELPAIFRYSLLRVYYWSEIELVCYDSARTSIEKFYEQL
jgi:hypothetical protein